MGRKRPPTILGPRISNKSSLPLERYVAARNIIVDETVHDPHSLARDPNIWMNLLQNLEDVDLVSLNALLRPVLLLVSGDSFFPAFDFFSATVDFFSSAGFFSAGFFSTAALDYSASIFRKKTSFFDLFDSSRALESTTKPLLSPFVSFSSNPVEKVQLIGNILAMLCEVTLN
ncbi:hypothetical protein LOK49_LG10G01022 [Camellia lanceoleosa]|uniref:Uncharacterized protein n=1 Tax=Camellia lanceoleosa TaxID=1840588 RepID=A0ACC0GCV7_9ERIC|nr:hypothetical protein LOK49_LG10G01022 [Camellia lanceoleosa]